MRVKRHRPGSVAEPEADVERTGYVPVPDVDVYTEYPTDEFGPDDADAAFADELLDGHDVIAWPPSPRSTFRRRVSKTLLSTGAVLIALLAIYAVDLLANFGDVPRGVVVLGVEVGGLPQQEAEAKLRRELEPRLTEPVTVRAGDVRTTLDPATSGLNLNWAATLEKAGRQPINPITRLLSFFTTREVDVVSSVNVTKLRAAVTELAQKELNHPPTEGSIDFEPVPGDETAVHAFAVEPRQGQRLADIEQAVRIIKESWLRAGGVALPVQVTRVRATSAGVHAALERIVKPMISAPVRLRGDGVQAMLEPSSIAKALRFAPLDSGALQVSVDRAVLQKAVRPNLQPSEEQSRSAQLAFTGSRPAVQPGHKGRTIDWAATFEPFVEVAKRPENRVLQVEYSVITPEITTAELDGLGIDEVIGEFSIGGLSGTAEHNVATIAAEVNGTLIQPGETFRLNAHTGPRTGASGYLPAPTHPDGSGTDVMGGGVSAFTSALFNAAYLAGMKDVGHTVHHHYFSGFPAARDAVSLSAAGDPVGMAFTNDAPTGVLIRADISGGTVTVTLWGTKHYRVETSTGSRSDVTPPSVEHHTKEGCEPRDGAPGFTVSTTRVLYDLDTGKEVHRGTTTVTYAPRPKVVCHAP